MSDPTESLAISWMPYWDRFSDQNAKRAYVFDELKKLVEAGMPPLTAALTLPLSEQCDMALAALKARQSVVYVRLHQGAEPPPVDPYGRPLHPSKVGKVFVAKLKTNGARAGASGEESAGWTGTARQAKNRPGNTRDPLYDTVEIGKDAVVALPVEDAAPLMTRWGFGVRSERRQGKAPVRDASGNVKRGPSGEELRGRDTWLLVECDPQGKPIGYPSEEPKPAKGRAA